MTDEREPSDIKTLVGYLIEERSERSPYSSHANHRTAWSEDGLPELELVLARDGIANLQFTGCTYR
jgi:hypothetical protein